MSSQAPDVRATALFQRTRVSSRDQRVFLGKLLVAAALLAAFGYLALRPRWWEAVCGTVLLGALYTHLVELQHQCLHHSALRRPRAHRVLGVPLGLPLLVSYSHYRVLHLQHHRHLGTPRDSEFFGFDSRRPITWRRLAAGLLDYRRIGVVLAEIGHSARGTWRYGSGPIADRRRREIIAEYRLMGLLVLVACGACVGGFAGPVLRLWLIPLIVAVPLHFVVELPEHVLCDAQSTDVLRNTRSIRGSWFSTWYTNGNNLHIEHHAAMMVPINRLRERHPEVQRLSRNVETSYPAFFRLMVGEARRNARSAG